MTGRRPLLVGLTGSIGMGKSETAGMFASLGIPVYDADAAVHRLYAPGGEAVAAIETAFPECVRAGQVDRACLSGKIRADPTALLRLEAIVHPLVARDQEAFVAGAAAAGADFVVLDIPLLFETGSHSRMDAIIVATAPEDVQRARVLARPGMSEALFGQILSRQLPDVDKRKRADFVVETDKGMSHALEQVKRIVSELRARRRSGHA
ncbi:MAG TPA: dephospho-CoA kinase [Rhizomicrobium sp.]|jgi:dephospho-CoA kinase|nr:dephospho-CoA kinase [Rhizomicrobium sp.]